MLRHAGKWMIVIVVAALALLPLLPGAVDSYAFSFLFFVFVYAIMAQGWNLIAGFGGQISLGNHAFFGLGAYTTAILWSGNYLWGSLYETHPRIYYFDPLTMALSGLVAAFAAIVVGLPLLSKLRGDYFALGTLGFGEIVKVILINGGDFTGGAFGVVAPASTFDTLRPHYLVALGLNVGIALAIVALMRSRYGLALVAVRDDEMAASANGVDTLRVKVAAFAGSAFIAGIAGSLYSYYIFHVGPDFRVRPRLDAAAADDDGRRRRRDDYGADRRRVRHVRGFRFRADHGAELPSHHLGTDHHPGDAVSAEGHLADRQREVRADGRVEVARRRRRQCSEPRILSRSSRGATSNLLLKAREKCALELNPHAKAICEIETELRAGDSNSSLLRSSRRSQTKRSSVTPAPSNARCK